MTLPDVIGIGTRRSGSSWLHDVLSSHPDIGKPKDGLHFFSCQFDRGLDWYSDALSDYANKSVVAEFSVSYLYPEHAEQAARRMAEVVPQCKLFLCVREPVERAFSDYLRSIRVHEIDNEMDFETAIRQDPALLDRGRYSKLLAPYLEAFPAERIKVLFYEDLRDDPVNFATELATFLGVEPNFDRQWVERNEPTGKAIRFPALNKAVSNAKAGADAAFNYLGAGEWWSNWKARHVYTYEKVIDLNHKERQLQTATASRLRPTFSEDVRFLETLTGRNLDTWR